MAATRQRIQAPIDVVFDVLVEPRTYPEWLVGARDIRAGHEDAFDFRRQFLRSSRVPPGTRKGPPDTRQRSPGGPLRVQDAAP